MKRPKQRAEMPVLAGYCPTDFYPFSLTLAEMKVHFGNSSLAHNNYYSNVQPVRFHLNSSFKGFFQQI